jgi:hypothetical protein
MTHDDMIKVKDAIELLLQCMELFPDTAGKHVKEYVEYGELCALQDAVKEAISKK